jgi:hypothetical protein
VFINDKFEDLIPRWLLFIRGVVDSDDLPLNVGREILQQSRSLRIIKQRLVKKSIDMMAELAASDTAKYDTFWKNFGKYIKVGIIEDEKARPDLIPLCRFFTSHQGSSSGDDEEGEGEKKREGAATGGGGDVTSLPDYVSRMPDDQKNIYYVVGETRAQAAMSPALEKLKQKNYEILYVFCYTIVLPSFFSCFIMVSLSPLFVHLLLRACLCSMTPHDTSLTITSIPQSIINQSTILTLLITTLQVRCTFQYNTIPPVQLLLPAFLPFACCLSSTACILWNVMARI